MSKYYIKKEYVHNIKGKYIKKLRHRGFIYLSGNRIKIDLIENENYHNLTKELFNNFLNLLKDYNYILIDVNNHKKSSNPNGRRNIMYRRKIGEKLK